MSNIQQLLNSWNSSLKNEGENCKTILIHIVKETKTVKNQRSKQKLIHTLLSSLSKAYCNKDVSEDLCINLFQEIIAFSDDDHWEGILPYLSYIMSSLVTNKNSASKLLQLIPLVKIQESLNESSIQHLFEVYKTPVSYLIYHGILMGNKRSIYFEKISTLLGAAFRLNESLFINFTTEIYSYSNFIRHNIIKYYEDAKEFLEEHFSMIRQLKSIEFIDLYGSITQIFLVLFNIETDRKVKNVEFTSSFIKSCLTIDKINEHKYANYSLNLFQLLLRLYNKRHSPSFNKNLEDLLSNLSKLIKSDQKEEKWYMDTIATFVGFLLYFSKDVAEYFNETNIVSIFEISIQIMNILPGVQYRKSICSQCTSLRRHSMFTVVRAMTKFYGKSVELKIEDNSVHKSMVKMLKYLGEVNSNPSCSFESVLAKNICIEIYNYIPSITSQKHATTAVQLLNVLEQFNKDTPIMLPPRRIFLYKKMYSILKDFKICIYMHCLYIIYLISNDNYKKESVIAEIVHCLKMFDNAGYDKSMTLSEIIIKHSEKIETLPEPHYDKKVLLDLQFEVILTYFTDEQLKEVMAEKVVEEIKNDLEFAIFVQRIGSITIPNMMKRIQKSITILSNQIKQVRIKANYYLALAFLHKRLFVYKCEKSKKLFVDKPSSEETLQKMDLTEFKKVDICLENSILECGWRCLDYITKFLVHENECTLDFKIENVMEIASYLARHFELRGQLEYACRAWKVVYEIACKENNVFNKIRAVSFFCENYHILRYTEENLKILELAQEISPDIVEYFDKINSITRKQQNYVMRCMLNIANVYAVENDFESALMLIRAVEFQLEKLREINKEFGLIDATLHMTSFNITSKYNSPEISPYTYAFFILEALKNIKYITSEDTINVPNFLLHSLTDLSKFLLNRFYASSVRPYLYMLLRYSMDYGLTLRITELCSYLAHVDLQEEKSSECMIKLLIIKILLKRDDLEETNVKNKPSSNPYPHSTLVPVDRSQRHTNRLPLSPENIKLPISYSKDCLTRYLISHPPTCNCICCKYPGFSMIWFQIGVLNARCYYMNEDYTVAENFFKEVSRWWMKISNPYLKLLFADMALWAQVYYINTLRRLKNYTMAKDVCDITLKFYNGYKHALDVAHLHNLVEQKSAVEYIAPSTTPNPSHRTRKKQV